MAEIQKQLLAVVTDLRTDLILSFKSNGRFATGNTEQNIEAIATDDDAQLLGPFWIYALQDGRKPTSEGAAKGDPTLFEQIQVWCAAKGIAPNLAYAITQHIHKYGYPGTPGIIDTPLSDDNVEKVLQKQLTFMAELFQNEVARTIVIPQSDKSPTLQPVS